MVVSRWWRVGAGVVAASMLAGLVLVMQRGGGDPANAAPPAPTGRPKLVDPLKLPYGWVVVSGGDQVLDRASMTYQTVAPGTAIDPAPAGTLALTQPTGQEDYVEWSITDLHSGEAHPLPSGSSSTVWSPDGQRLAQRVFGKTSGRAEVVVISAATGRTVLRFPTADDLGCCVAPLTWVPKTGEIGVTIVSRPGSEEVPENTIGMQLYSGITGRPTRQFRFQAGRVVTYSWSPDGQRVAVHDEDNQRSMLVSAATGKELATGPDAKLFWARPDRLLQVSFDTLTVVDAQLRPLEVHRLPETVRDRGIVPFRLAPK